MVSIVSCYRHIMVNLDRIKFNYATKYLCSYFGISILDKVIYFSENFSILHLLYMSIFSDLYRVMKAIIHICGIGTHGRLHLYNILWTVSAINSENTYTVVL